MAVAAVLAILLSVTLTLAIESRKTSSHSMTVFVAITT